MVEGPQRPAPPDSLRQGNVPVERSETPHSGLTLAECRCTLATRVAFIPVHNGLEIKVFGAIGLGRNYVTTVHADNIAGTPITQANADNIMLLLHDAYTTSTFSGTLNNTWTLTEISVTALDTANGLQFHSTAHPLVGGFGGQLLPTQTALLLRLNTELRGASFRGRWYHAGLSETSSDGKWVATTITQAQGMANDWIASMAAASFPLSVVSRFSGTHLVAGPGGQTLRRPLARGAGILTHIEAAIAEPSPATIRRRRAA